MEKLICFQLKIIIFLKDILYTLSLLNFSIVEVVLFKDKLSYEILDKLSNSNWKYKELSINPYIGGYAK